jgi:invasion protein IalB
MLPDTPLAYWRVLAMSHLRTTFLALLLAGMPAIDGKAVTKQQIGNLGSARKGAPPGRPMLVKSTTTASTAQLPNGASAISEIYGDWAMDCKVLNNQKQCRLLQIQTDQTNQRVLEVELRMPMDGKVDGTIAMPFGVKLDSGAIIRLDDAVFSKEFRFLTCVQVGCLLPVSFSMNDVDAMKNGKTLAIMSFNINDNIIALNVPLDGFAEAIARATELAKWKPSSMIAE